MKCSNCGAELQEGMKFCPECGMRIKGTKIINGPRDRRAVAPADAKADIDAAAIPKEAAGGQAPIQEDAGKIDTGEFAPSMHAAEPSGQVSEEPAQRKEGNVPSFLQSALKRFTSRKEEAAPADAAPGTEEDAAPEAVPEAAAQEPAQEEGAPVGEAAAPSEDVGAEAEAAAAEPSDAAGPEEPAPEVRKGSVLRGKPVVRIHIHAKGEPEDVEPQDDGPSEEPLEDDEPTGKLPRVNPAEVPSVEDGSEEASGDEPAAADEQQVGEDAGLSGFDGEPEAGEDDFGDDYDVIPTEPIFGLEEELPEIETAEEELSHVPQIDEELASADQSELPEDLPAGVDDVDDEEAGPSPVSYVPLRTMARHQLHVNGRRMERADGQLRPLSPYVSTDLPAMDEEIDGGDHGSAIPEADGRPEGAVAPEPIVQRSQRDARPQERGPREERPQKKGAPRHLVPILIACAAVACALIVVAVTGQMGTPSATSEQATTAEEPAAEEPAEQQGPTATLPSEAKSFGDYSWSELAGIAQAIEGASTRDEALSIAAQYRLADAEGAPTTETKELQLKDGTSAQVQVADIYADDKTDGGKAGITFLVSGSSRTHAMNVDGSNMGGWESSDMRKWLAQDLLPALPDELQPLIVPVEKLTNNAGYTADPASVTSTSDALWIPSFSEVFGSVEWYWQTSYDRNYNTILSSEGSQYACFAGINGMETASEVESATGIGIDVATWWLRTASPSVSSNFRDVSEVGGPLSVDNAAEEMGVVFGFCL